MSSAVVCPLCSALSPTLKLYISHLRLVHQADPNFKISCCIQDCTRSRTFCTFSAFNSHIYRCHRNCLGLSAKYDFQEDIGSTSQFSGTGQNTFDGLPQHSLSDDITEGCSDLDLGDSSTNIVQSAQLSTNEDLELLKQAKFLLRLREDKQVSQVALNEIICKCRHLCEQTFTTTLSRIKGVLSNAAINVDDVPGLSDIMDDSAPDYFQGVDTSYLLEEFARKQMGYIVSMHACTHFTYSFDTLIYINDSLGTSGNRSW